MERFQIRVHAVTPGCADAYNYGPGTKKSPNNAAIVLGSLTKAEKGQGNSFRATLGLSLTTYAHLLQNK